MAIGAADRAALAAIDARLKTVLPEQYQASYEAMQPVAMGSAGLRYDADGRVAWDEIWGSFCDLAMAGGPPHKGRLLEPASPADIAADRGAYDRVVEEICRGVTLASDLPAVDAGDPGWIRVSCYSEVMAAWLLRAIVMENVAVRARDRALFLPAGPAFRLAREIKNVVTVIAKTSHYYMGHMPRAQQRAIAALFTALAVEAPLIEPAVAKAGGDADARQALSARIHALTGLAAAPAEYAGWLGVMCPDVPVAVWMMRALVVSNVLARREETTVFVPINPAADPHGERVAQVLAQVHRLAMIRWG